MDKSLARGVAGCQGWAKSCGSWAGTGLRAAGKMDEGLCEGGGGCTSLVIVWGEVVITD